MAVSAILSHTTASSAQKNHLRHYWRKKAQLFRVPIQLFTFFQPVHEHYPAFTPGIDELELAVLDDIYTDSRYPGSKGMLPTGVPTHDEARQFIRLAETLLGAAEKMVA